MRVYKQNNYNSHVLEQLQKAVTILENPDIIGQDSLMLKDQVMNLKERYVKEVHPYKITEQKRGRWKTYIKDVSGKLKGVERNKRLDLINYLYDYYSQETNKTTVRAVFEEFMCYKKTVLNRSQGTIEKNQYTFKQFGHFCDQDIGSVTQEKIGKLVQDYIKEYQPIESALKAFIQLVHGIFRFALMKDYISKDVSLCLDVNAYFKDCSHKQVLSEEKIFTPEQTELIMQTAQKRLPNPRAYAILMAIQTGMRSGELCALQWSDVDFEKRILHIHRQQILDVVDGKRQGFHEVEYTKDERRRPHGGRFFPLTDALTKLLEEILESQKEPCDYVFSDHGSYVEKTSYEKYLNRLCKSLGINITRNHAFRMTLNSNALMQSGLNTKQRAYILGHSVTTNERYYTYTRQEEVEEIRDILNSNTSNTSNTETNACSLANTRYGNVVQFSEILASKTQKEKGFKACNHRTSQP